MTFKVNIKNSISKIPKQSIRLIFSSLIFDQKCTSEVCPLHVRLKYVVHLLASISTYLQSSLLLQSKKHSVSLLIEISLSKIEFEMQFVSVVIFLNEDPIKKHLIFLFLFR